MRRSFPPALGVTVALLALAACGSPAAHPRSKPTSTTDTETGTALTQTQAFQLSSALYDDYQAEGASVVVNVPYTSSISVGIVGDIDFQHHEGHLVVTTVDAGTGTSIEDVDYTETEVFEQGGPVVAQELAQHGSPGETWVGRAPDPTDRPVDKVVEILVALASPARDNPLLIQESDARYEGTAVLDGANVNVFKYNQAITYYVDAREGVLRRFIGSVQGFVGPITVDISSLGPRSEPPPPAPAVLFVSSSTGSTTTTLTG